MFIHSIQLQIALAFVDLLSPSLGSRFVYSTCSLNPLEDESVVCAVLRRHGGSLRLVDLKAGIAALELELELEQVPPASTSLEVSDKLKKLHHFKWREGLSSWRTDVDVMVNEGASDSDSDSGGSDSDLDAGHEDSPANSNTNTSKEAKAGAGAGPGELKRKRAEKGRKQALRVQERKRSVAKLPALLPSMLPPTPPEARNFHPERTMRVMPHDQNTGGFFIAVFERYAAPVPVSVSVSVSASSQAAIDPPPAHSSSLSPAQAQAQVPAPVPAGSDSKSGLSSSGVTHEKELSILKNICGFNPKQISISNTMAVPKARDGQNSVAVAGALSAEGQKPLLLAQWREACNVHNSKVLPEAVLHHLCQLTRPGEAACNGRRGAASLIGCPAHRTG